MTDSRPRGFTLIELLIGLVVTSVVAVSLLRMVMVDTRFAEDREAWRTARQATRGGLTVLWSDLRMVETAEGVEAATASGLDLTLRVPFAFGVLCATTGTLSTAALLPVDSAMYAQGGLSGFAWRNESTDQYTYVPGASVSGTGLSATCTAAGITVVSGGSVVLLSGTVPVTQAAGTVIFLYRRIRYELKSSVQMPGQIALWRTLLATGTTEELGAPLASTARFRYFVGTGGTSQAAVPSPLSSITGLELAFSGQSDRTPRGASGPKVVDFAAAIYFQNQSP